MLKLRVLTALVLVPLVVWSIYGASARTFALFFGGVFLIGAWEWGRISRVDNPVTRLLYVAFVAFLLGLLWYFTSNAQYRVMPEFLWAIFAWWVLAAVWVMRFKGASKPVPGTQRVRYLLAGLLVLCGPYYSLLVLRENPDFGPHYVMFVFILIWVADTGAYFAGRKWGRRKLAPVVSPGKSWEGVAGALVSTALAGWAGGVFFGFSKSQLMLFIVVCLLTTMFSVVGDLFESLVKRSGGMKDSGTILPGHGGVMDRIDSLTAAAPVFLLSIWITGNLQ